MARNRLTKLFKSSSSIVTENDLNWLWLHFGEKILRKFLSEFEHPMRAVTDAIMKRLGDTRNTRLIGNDGLLKLIIDMGLHKFYIKTVIASLRDAIDKGYFNLGQYLYWAKEMSGEYEFSLLESYKNARQNLHRVENILEYNTRKIQPVENEISRLEKLLDEYKQTPEIHLYSSITNQYIPPVEGWWPGGDVYSAFDIIEGKTINGNGNGQESADRTLGYEAFRELVDNKIEKLRTEIKNLKSRIAKTKKALS